MGGVRRRLPGRMVHAIDRGVSAGGNHSGGRQVGGRRHRLAALSRTHGSPKRKFGRNRVAPGAASMIGALCERFVVLCGRAILRLSADCRVEGLEHVPRSGPIILAARHVHHALDGCVILAVVPRRVHAIVAVDWARPGPLRRLVDRACRLLAWPTVLRPDHPGATDRDEAARILRRATRDAVALLRDGRLLLLFPEAYPNIDPHWTPKSDLDAWLPFEDGFARLAHLAERDGETRVPVVPVGFHYRCGRRWQIVVRFGAPRRLPPDADLTRFVAEIEADVRTLSGL